MVRKVKEKNTFLGQCHAEALLKNQDEIPEEAGIEPDTCPPHWWDNVTDTCLICGMEREEPDATV